jgi:hypothetical protein
MILGGNKNIENSIITALSEQGSSAVEDIEDFIQRHKNTSSVQGIYRALRKLQKEGVIIKEKSKYSLKIPWILDLSKLVRSMEETHLNDGYLKKLLPEKNKKTWVFNHLEKAHDFKIQIMLALAKISQYKISLAFYPHSWFEVINAWQTAQFKKNFFSFINHQYTVIGGQGFVDRYASRITKNLQQETTYLAPQHDRIEKTRQTYINIIDDYVLCTTVDEETAKNIDIIYQNIINEDDMHLLEIFETFNHDTKIKMTIKKDPCHAGSYRKKFENLFGPLGKEW